MDTTGKDWTLGEKIPWHTWETLTWRRHQKPYGESRRSRPSVNLTVPQGQGEVPLSLFWLGGCQSHHHGPPGPVVVLHRCVLFQTDRLCQPLQPNRHLVFIRDLKIPLHHVIVRETFRVVRRKQLQGRRPFWQHQGNPSKSCETERSKIEWNHLKHKAKEVIPHLNPLTFDFITQAHIKLSALQLLSCWNVHRKVSLIQDLDISDPARSAVFTDDHVACSLKGLQGVAVSVWTSVCHVDLSQTRAREVYFKGLWWLQVPGEPAVETRQGQRAGVGQDDVAVAPLCSTLWKTFDQIDCQHNKPTFPVNTPLDFTPSYRCFAQFPRWTHPRVCCNQTPPSEERCLSPPSKCYTVWCVQSWCTLYNRWPDDSWSWWCCPCRGQGSALGHLNVRQKTGRLKPNYIWNLSVNLIGLQQVLFFLGFFYSQLNEAVMTNLMLETLLWFTKPVLGKYCQHTLGIVYSLCVYVVNTWFSVGFWNETEMIWEMMHEIIGSGSVWSRQKLFKKPVK